MKVEIPSGNLVLEGLWVPPGAEGKGPGCVICHPHPLFGGSMDNNVTYALRDRLSEAGFGVLCFNFRGVGRSQGRYDEGQGEVDDVLSALAFIRRQDSVNENQVFLAGYSFGGLMALYGACREDSLSGLALISPLAPGSGFSRDARLDPFWTLGTPFIIVYGTRDAFCPESAVADLNRAAGIRGRLSALKGADHFYLGREDEMAGPVVQFFSELLIQAGPSISQAPG
jgi:alpha/beta superfamily hydrolase